jgi:hypothetical protein
VIFENQFHHHLGGIGLVADERGLGLGDRHDDPVICTYDLSKFSASMVMDVMRTHPVEIMGGVLQDNPFFVPPDQFLLELRERPRSARAR